MKITEAQSHVEMWECIPEHLKDLDIFLDLGFDICLNLPRATVYFHWVSHVDRGNLGCVLIEGLSNPTVNSAEDLFEDVFNPSKEELEIFKLDNGCDFIFTEDGNINPKYL